MPAFWNFVLDLFNHVGGLVLSILGFELRSGTSELDKAVILALMTAIFAAAGYIFKAVGALAVRLIAERRKFRTAQIRYVYDVEIWMEDFRKRFGPDEAARLVDLLMGGDDKFKFGLAASPKEEDSQKIMKYIHWLRAAEVYTIRRFIQYGELFEATCAAISSSSYSDLTLARKMDGLIIVFETGRSAYEFGRQSLEAIRTPKPSILRVLLRAFHAFLAALVRQRRQKHLYSVSAINNDGGTEHGWPKWKLDDFKRDAREKVLARASGQKEVAVVYS